MKAKVNTIDELCKILKFRSHNPKIIDLTSNDTRMPTELKEFVVKCSRDEKDLYMYFYLN
jgi:hypothetical protein